MDYACGRRQFPGRYFNFLGKSYLQRANSHKVASFGSTHILVGPHYQDIIAFEGTGQFFEGETCVGSQIASQVTQFFGKKMYILGTTQQPTILVAEASTFLE